MIRVLRGSDEASCSCFGLDWQRTSLHALAPTASASIDAIRVVRMQGGLGGNCTHRSKTHGAQNRVCRASNGAPKGQTNLGVCFVFSCCFSVVYSVFGVYDIPKLLINDS